MQDLPKLVLSSDEDRLFSQGNYPKPFAFNEEVVAVFDDMVKRSIPLYQDVTRYVTRWALSVCKEGDKIYDLGCSTGTSMLHIMQSLPFSAHFIGVDNAPAMIEKAKLKLEQHSAQHRYELLCQNLNNVSISAAKFTIMNYTLQFLPVSERSLLLKKIYEGSKPGAILFLSEKVRACCPEFQETTTRIYESFKQEQGYSRHEIAKKKEALENVLVPFTVEEHMENLRQAGFTKIEMVMRWNNFVSFVALKEAHH